MATEKDWQFNYEQRIVDQNQLTQRDNSSNNLEKQLIKSLQYQQQCPMKPSNIIVQNDKNFYKVSEIEEKVQQIKSLQQMINTTENINIQLDNQNGLISQKIQEMKTHYIKCFEINEGKTINLENNNSTATQSIVYHQNKKIILSEIISSRSAEAVFRVQYAKYCVGFGICLKQVIQNHDYSYQSYGNGNQLGHGLYIITSQGYSWSHSEKNQDDIPREGFNTLYAGSKVTVKLEGQNLSFNFKKYNFNLTINSQIQKKYRLCFCAYLHEKQDSVSLI